METKFKTFITPNGEYGIIDCGGVDGNWISFMTSSRPELLSIEATIEQLKEYFNEPERFKYADHGDPDIYDDWSIIDFDWDEHFPKDWKLVEIELTIK